MSRESTEQQLTAEQLEKSRMSFQEQMRQIRLEQEAKYAKTQQQQEETAAYESENDMQLSDAEAEEIVAVDTYYSATSVPVAPPSFEDIYEGDHMADSDLDDIPFGFDDEDDEEFGCQDFDDFPEEPSTTFSSSDDSRTSEQPSVQQEPCVVSEYVAPVDNEILALREIWAARHRQQQAKAGIAAYSELADLFTEVRKVNLFDKSIQLNGLSLIDINGYDMFKKMFEHIGQMADHAFIFQVQKSYNKNIYLFSHEMIKLIEKFKQEYPYENGKGRFDDFYQDVHETMRRMSKKRASGSQISDREDFNINCNNFLNDYSMTDRYIDEHAVKFMLIQNSYAKLYNCYEGLLTKIQSTIESLVADEAEPETRSSFRI